MTLLPSAEFKLIDRQGEPKRIEYVLFIARIPGSAIQYRSKVLLDDRSPLQAMEDALVQAAEAIRLYKTFDNEEHAPQ